MADIGMDIHMLGSLIEGLGTRFTDDPVRLKSYEKEIAEAHADLGRLLRQVKGLHVVMEAAE